MAGVSDSYDWGGSGSPTSALSTDRRHFGQKRLLHHRRYQGRHQQYADGRRVDQAGEGTYWGEPWAADNLNDTKDGINGLNTVFGQNGYPTGASSSPDNSGFSSYHSGGCNFLLADGSTSFLSQNISQNVLISLTTRDGANFHSYSTTATSDPVFVSGPP